MNRSGAALASGVPHQELGTFSERLLLPQIHFVLLGYLPLPMMRWTKRPAFSAGCGQLFVIRRDARSRWRPRTHSHHVARWREAAAFVSASRFQDGFVRRDGYCDLPDVSHQRRSLARVLVRMRRKVSPRRDNLADEFVAVRRAGAAIPVVVGTRKWLLKVSRWRWLPLCWRFAALDRGGAFRQPLGGRCCIPRRAGVVDDSVVGAGPAARR